jgi:hypothetical protein
VEEPELGLVNQVARGGQSGEGVVGYVVDGLETGAYTTGLDPELGDGE